MRPATTLLWLAGAVLLSACAGQQTYDRKLYKVVGPEGVNYYRVTIQSDGYLADADYETGLFPAYAVDAYVGQGSKFSTVGTDAEEALRELVVKRQRLVIESYFEAVQGLPPGAPEGAEPLTGAAYATNLESAAERLRAAQQLPIVAKPPKGYAGLGFNPVMSLVDHSFGKKFVIAFSADPDAILGQIDAFVEEAETTKALTGSLTSLLAQRDGVDLQALQRDRSRRLQAATRLEALAGAGDDDPVGSLAATLDGARAVLGGLR